MLQPELPLQQVQQLTNIITDNGQINSKYQMLPSSGQLKFLNGIKGFSLRAQYCCIFQKNFKYKIKPYDPELSNEQNNAMQIIAQTEKGRLGCCEKNLYSMNVISGFENAGLIQEKRPSCCSCCSNVIYNIYTGPSKDANVMAYFEMVKDCKICCNGQSYLAIKDAFGKLLYTVGKFPEEKCSLCCVPQCKRMKCCPQITCFCKCFCKQKCCPEFFYPVMDAQENMLPPVRFEQTCRQFCLSFNYDFIYRYTFPADMPDTHRYLILQATMFCQHYRL